jgi:hypothetical protein
LWSLLRASAGSIGSIAVFRDHTLKTEPAGVAQDEFAIFLEMLAVLQRLRCTAEQGLERRLPLDHGRGTQVLAV